MRIGKYDLIFSAISGVLLALAFMIPYGGILAWFLLVPLFLAIEDKSPWNAFRLGLLAGTITNFVSAYWIMGTMVRFGGFPYVISTLFHLIFSMYSGLSLAIFAYISARLGLFRKPGLLSALLIAAVWTSVEFFFPFLFPYGITNSQAPFIPVIQIYDLFGMYSLSFLIVLVNVTLARMCKSLREKSRIPGIEIAVSLVLVALTLSYGFWKIGVEDRKIAEAPKLKVGIVQANFDFFEKTEDNQDIISQKHRAMSRSLKSPDLIVWPETAVQAWIPISSDWLKENDKIVIPEIEGSYFLVGGLSYSVDEAGPDDVQSDENVDQFNTAFLTDAEGKILERYHKIKLLLFGEYLPLSKYFPSIKKLSPATGDFIPGSELNLFELKAKGVKIAPLICYEDIIPSFSRKFVAKGANLIVNITNDAWFGRSTAPYQHLLVSVPRAVETRRYLIRATNTGVSAVIDPVGRIVAATDIFKPATLEEEVGIMNEEITLYTRTGDVFSWGCLAFWVGFGVTRFLATKARTRKE